MSDAASYEHKIVAAPEIQPHLNDGWEPTPGAPIVQQTKRAGEDYKMQYVFMRRLLKTA